MKPQICGMNINKIFNIWNQHLLGCPWYLVTGWFHPYISRLNLRPLSRWNHPTNLTIVNRSLPWVHPPSATCFFFIAQKNQFPCFSSRHLCIQPSYPPQPCSRRSVAAFDKEEVFKFLAWTWEGDSTCMNGWFLLRKWVGKYTKNFRCIPMGSSKFLTFNIFNPFLHVTFFLNIVTKWW